MRRQSRQKCCLAIFLSNYSCTIDKYGGLPLPWQNLEKLTSNFKNLFVKEKKKIILSKQTNLKEFQLKAISNKKLK